MTTTNNGIPLYAEEIIINQEFDQIQETLSQFKQPIPNDFIELEQLNWMCSTQGWKEPVCERYNCLIKGEWKQVDIARTLLDKLELTKNIPYPVHISPTVINQGSDRYLAYNVKEEKEIFLQKPFTIQNLKQNLGKLFQQIEELQREKEENQETIRDLEKTKNDWKNEWLNEWRKKNNLEKEIQAFTQELKGEKQLGQSQKEVYQQKIQHLQIQLNQIQNEHNILPALPSFADYQFLQTERDNAQTRLGINDLNNLPALLQGETLTSLLARPTQVQYQNLNGQLIAANASITQKNTQIANLTQQVNSANNRENNLQTQLNIANAELKKEQDWWDKWFNDDNAIIHFAEHPELEKIAEEIFPGHFKGCRLEIELEPKFERVNLIRKFDYLREASWYPTINAKRGKREIIKIFYQYYRNK